MPKAKLSTLSLRCPPLPGTFKEALDLMDTPDEVSIERVKVIAERDPTVVARLLRTVNSAYYGLSHEVTCVERATILLGVTQVLSQITSTHLAMFKHALEGPAQQCFERLIYHSVATAFLTRHILERMQSVDSEVASDGFTAGLMHDFGKIVLVYNLPEEAVALYEEERFEENIEETDLLHRERLVFGIDHIEAGRFAANKLDFPDILSTAIQGHHTNDLVFEEGNKGRILRAVTVANHTVKAMGYVFTRPSQKDMQIYETNWNHLMEHDIPNDEEPQDIIAMLATYQQDMRDYVNKLIAACDEADMKDLDILGSNR